MVSDSDLFAQVVVIGDPTVPDGTVGRLMNVFPACVVIETPPDADNPDGGQEIVALDAVRVLGNSAAA